MQSLLALAIWTWVVTVAACNDKLKIPVGVLYREGEEEIVRSIKSSFYRQRNDNFSLRVIEQPYGFSFQINRRVCILLQKGITVLIASTSYTETSDILVTISNNYHLPLINLLSSESGRKKSHFDLSMTMNTVKTSLDMISFYGWKSAIYVRDKVHEPESLLDLLEDGNFDMTLDSVINGDSAETILETIETLTRNFSKELNIILDIPLEAIYDILPMLLTEYDERIVYFLITRPVSEEFWKSSFLKNMKSKIIAFNMIDEAESNSQLLFSRADEPLLSYDAGKVIFKAINQLYKVNSSYVKELSINNTKKLSNCKFNPSIPWIHGLSVARALKEVKNCQGYTGNIQFDSRGRRRMYKLNIFEISQNKSKKIGSWSDKNGLLLHEPIAVSHRKVSWQSTKPTEKQKNILIVTSILVEPYLMKKDISYVGFCKDLLDILSEKLNFHYQFKIVEDGKFGIYNNSNKKWTGMIGEIASEKADLAVAPLTINLERSRAVAFTTPFQYGGITLLARKAYPAQSFLLFRPFSWEVWVFVVIVYIIFGTFLFSVDYFISESLEKSRFIHHKQYYNSVPRKSICSRSWTAFIGKIICLIFTIAVLSLYIAKLTAIMNSDGSRNARYELLSTKEIFENSVTTGTPKILLLKGGSTMKYFQKSQLPLYNQYWRRVVDHPDLFVNSYSEGLERIMTSNDGDTMLLLESQLGDYISAINCDSFVTLAGNLNTQKYGIALPSRSPLRFSLNNQIMLLQEDGTLDKLREKWWKKDSNCDAPIISSNIYKDENESLKFRDICGLFYVMIFSFVIIAVMSICQFLRQKYQKFHQEKEGKWTSLSEELKSVVKE